jgi:hypothetical protein
MCQDVIDPARNSPRERLIRACAALERIEARQRGGAQEFLRLALLRLGTDTGRQLQATGADRPKIQYHLA